MNKKASSMRIVEAFFVFSVVVLLVLLGKKIVCLSGYFVKKCIDKQ